MSKVTAVHVLRFDTQDDLEEYVETALNENGVEPSVGLIDSGGVQTMAHRLAPGGDGYAFEYAVNDREPETGGLHCCECYECGETCHNGTRTWTPEFPVWVMERDDAGVSR